MEGSPVAPVEKDDTLDATLSVVGVGTELFNLFKRAMKLDERFAKIPAFARGAIFAKLAVAVIGSANASAPDIETMTNTLNSVARTYNIEQTQRATEANKAEQGQVEVQFQAFLDKIRPYATEVRATFGERPTVMQERAIRFAFGDILAGDNEVMEKKLYEAENFDERLAEVLGAPASIDDILEKEFAGFGQEEKGARSKFDASASKRQGVRLDDLNPDQTPKQIGIDLERYRPKMSPDYARFVTSLAEIFRSPSFKGMQKIVGDTGQLMALEVLLNPKFFDKGIGEFEVDEKGEMKEISEVEWAKRTIQLSQAIDLMHPDILQKSIR